MRRDAQQHDIVLIPKRGELVSHLLQSLIGNAEPFPDKSVVPPTSQLDLCRHTHLRLCVNRTEEQVEAEAEVARLQEVEEFRQSQIQCIRVSSMGPFLPLAWPLQLMLGACVCVGLEAQKAGCRRRRTN